MARRSRSKRQQALDSLSVEQLRCRAFRYHAWEDVDMMPMVWGVMKVDHWRLECTRCGNQATEYRDPVTGERVEYTQRQYLAKPGYSLGIQFDPGEFFQELRARRLGSPGAQKRYQRERANLQVLDGGAEAADAG